jgi:flagellar motor protein MotB
LAEFHPRVPNSSPENRASNRRIDLVILNQATTTTEEPRQQR